MPRCNPLPGFLSRFRPRIFLSLMVATGSLSTSSLSAKEYIPEDPLEKDLLEFVTYEVEIEGETWKDSSRFPPLVWESPDRVLSIIGQCPLTVRWFDKELAEVSKPDGKPPYVAYLEGRSEHGQHIRRMITASPGGKALTTSSQAACVE